MFHKNFLFENVLIVIVMTVHFVSANAVHASSHFNIDNCSTTTLDSFSIGFKKSKVNIQRKSKEISLKKVKLNMSNLSGDTLYHISIQIDQSKTTLAPKDYLIELTNSQVNGVSNGSDINCYITIFPDSLPDRKRYIYFSIQVSVNGRTVSHLNTSENQLLVLEVNDYQELDHMDYLAHLGTNFDLVDGIQPKNLFFATNAFIPNKKTKFPATGVYFSLYGNRSFSSSDSLKNISRLIEVEPLSDSSQLEIRQMSNRMSIFSSDNLGAQVSFPIAISNLSNKQNTAKAWLSPTAEFIWRRSKNKISYINIGGIDTTLTKRTKSELPSIIQDNEFTINTNRFEFNYGIGFFLDHTNDNISIRFNWAVGNSTPYLFQSSRSISNEAKFSELASDIYFSGKLYIIEPKSGITFQAEVFNRKRTPSPYYVVTLSKALKFRTLGNIFTPLTRSYE